MSIFSWNCKSIYNKLSEFKSYLYAAKPHICCLNETWIANGYLPTFINYKPYFSNRLNRGGGGLLTLVRNDIHSTLFNLPLFPNGSLEIQGITLYYDRKSLNIINVYNPNQTISKEEFHHYFTSFGQNYIVCGDFNSRHTLWDDRLPPNTSGKNLIDAIEDEDCILITRQNLPTYFHRQTNAFSTLDLAFAPSHIFSISETSLEDEIYSDHYPVIIDVALQPALSKIKKRQKWIFSNNWEAWQNQLPNLNSTNDPVLDNSLFTEAIVNTAKNNFKLTRDTVVIKYSKPWWNDACAAAVKDKHRAKNYFHRHPTIENYQTFKDKEKSCSAILYEAKQKSFREFINSMNVDTPVQQLWRNISCLSGKYKPPYLSPIIKNMNIFTDPKDKTFIIANTYKEAFNSKCSSRNAPSLMLSIAAASIEGENEPYNQKIEEFEVIQAIKTLKDTSPGIDLVHNNFLKNMPDLYITFITNLFNNSFAHSIIPQEWKCALIFPILKPAKDPTDPESRRPISVLSNIGKLMEKVLYNRLNYFIERNNLLSSSQGGFRKKMSTYDQIARVESSIRWAIASKQICLMVLIDLSKAYDLVWHLGLLHKLQEIGIKGKTLLWMREFLSNRAFKVYFEGHTSEEYKITAGVPQGSILSPLLFNIMLHDIPKTPGISSAEYADDITIFAVGNNMGDLLQLIQSHLNKIQTWARSWGLKISTLKTKAIFFTNKRNINPPPLTLGGITLDYVVEAKYLGMILDAPKLNWKLHVRDLKTALISRVNILKTLSAKHWGADRATLGKIYRAIIRSKIDYGAIFYDTASYSLLQSLDKIQNSCLRLILGAQFTSPISSLEVESNFPPLVLHRQELILRNFARFPQIPSYTDLWSDLKFFETLNTRWRKSLAFPYLLRALNLVKRYNLKLSLLPISSISPIPPWIDINKWFAPDFSEYPVSMLTDDRAFATFRHLQTTSYLNACEIYTDGSKLGPPHFSSAAALIIFLPNLTLMKKYKLPNEVEIMGCELFAIKLALQFILSNHQNLSNSKYVIYTDSLSGISSLSNRHPKNEVRIIYEIQDLLFVLNDLTQVIIQFIPGHKNIKGNELADLAANAGHANNETEIFHLSKNSVVKSIKTSLVRRWQTHWEFTVNSSGKGRHLLSIKDSVAHWPWALHKNRTTETVFAKLRIGHANFSHHLFRFGLTNSDSCTCGLPETIPHIFISCPLYSGERTDLYEKLQKINVSFNVKNLLGGGDFPPIKQFHIINYASVFLQKIGKLSRL